MILRAFFQTKNLDTYGFESFFDLLNRTFAPYFFETSEIFFESVDIYTSFIYLDFFACVIDQAIKGLPQKFIATRYHSLIIERDSLPNCLQVTAVAEDEVIMGLQHESLRLYGVQFHPESILSEYGYELLKNFLKGI